MSCEQEFNALRRAEMALARFRQQHPAAVGGQPQPDPYPAPGPAPGPRPGPSPIPEPTPAPEPRPDPDPIPHPVPMPPPTPTPIPDPIPGPTPTPDPHPSPNPIPEPGPEPGPAPVGGATEALSQTEARQRIAELMADLQDKQDAYQRCLGYEAGVSGVEALMRDVTGRPLGGGAGPPM